MTKTRIHTAELARLFEGVTAPLYVLDEDLTLVFLNEACRAWLGAAAEGLVGCRCAYHSSPQAAGLAATAAALCPPPTIAERGEMTADVAAPDGQSRPARFTALRAAGDVFAIIALLLPSETSAEPAETPADATSVDLHAELRRFRRGLAGRYAFDRLCGHSPAMRRVRAQAEVVASCRASVLVVGPPGSGRQHLASAIHYAAQQEKGTVPFSPAFSPDAGRRAATGTESSGENRDSPREPLGALVPVACELLGPELIHSTLGALRKPEFAEEVGGVGTLVLCEVDRLPPEVQQEVVATLSARSFRMRLMATAERPLDDLARRGLYRDDLAALLSTMVIELPSLAERRGDVPLLAQWFLEEANARAGRQIAGFTPEALDRLHAYGWPGNLNELAEVVEQSCRRAGGREITPADLPERLMLAAQAAARPRPKEETIVLDEFVGRIQRELIRRALVRAKGNKAKAARLLGLTRPRLYRRMVQLGLENDPGQGRAGESSP
jgi:DNA-binding NtrC family response regulator